MTWRRVTRDDDVYTTTDDGVEFDFGQPLAINEETGEIVTKEDWPASLPLQQFTSLQSHELDKEISRCEGAQSWGQGTRSGWLCELRQMRDDRDSDGDILLSLVEDANEEQVRLASEVAEANAEDVAAISRLDVDGFGNDAQRDWYEVVDGQLFACASRRSFDDTYAGYESVVVPQWVIDAAHLRLREPQDM
jgi:hypothetical protein